MANASTHSAPALAVYSRWLLASDAQARLTLGKMRHLVEKALQTENFVWWAREVIAATGVETRNVRSVAYAVREYVARHIQFMPDPVGSEHLTPPVEHMMRLKLAPRARLLGDCDDAATLSAALAGIAGIPSTFTVLAFRRADAPYQHVLTTLYPRKAAPVVCDTTRDAQNFPPVETRRLTVPALGRV